MPKLKQRKFQSLTEVSKYLAPLVQVSAGRLRRNKQYRLRIEPLVTLSDKEAESRRNLLNLQADRGRDLERIRVLEAHLSMQESPLPSTTDTEGVSKGTDYRAAFLETAMVLNDIIERYKELGLQVDLESASIVDRSARPGAQILASTVQARFFIEWYRLKNLEGTRTGWDSNPR